MIHVSLRWKRILAALFATVMLIPFGGSESRVSAANPQQKERPILLNLPLNRIKDEKKASSAALPAQSVPTPSEDPLQFTFPTPPADSVTAWRPPLLPPPWALTPYDHFYFSRPIGVDDVNWGSADYRYGDLFPDSDVVHTGIDIVANRGTPVIAAGAGEVTWAGEGLFKGGSFDGDPYGLAVAIRHRISFTGQEVYTVYAHMDRVDVQVGQQVEAGERLGIVGNTGKTTGPHLHFEVRVRNNSFFDTRNPELWLAPPEGWGVLAGKMIDRYGGPLIKINVKVISVATGNVWTARTYNPPTVNKDDYYQENVVMSDLPAGDYWIEFRVRWKNYRHKISINPGLVSYFTFEERQGTFSEALPPPGKESQFPSVNPDQFVTPVITQN